MLAGWSAVLRGRAAERDAGRLRCCDPGSPHTARVTFTPPLQTAGRIVLWISIDIHLQTTGFNQYILRINN